MKLSGKQHKENPMKSIFKSLEQIFSQTFPHSSVSRQATVGSQATYWRTLV